MDLIIAFLFITLVFSLATFGISAYNRLLFKINFSISRKWTAVVLSISIVFYIIITPETNNLSDELKKILIFWAISTSVIYILSNVIKDGLTVKYKDITIRTQKQENVSRETLDE